MALYAGGILALVGVAGALIVFFALRDDWEVLQRWRKVPATLFRVDIEQDTGRSAHAQWHVVVAYTFELDGKQHEGNQLAPTDAWMKRETAEWTVEQLRAQKDHFAWVDPKDPRRSVLTHSLESGPLPYALAAGIPFVLGVALLAWAVSRRE